MSREKPLIIPDISVRKGQASLRSPTSPKSLCLDATEVFSFILHDECVLVGALLIKITQELREGMYPSWHILLKSTGEEDTANHALAPSSFLMRVANTSIHISLAKVGHVARPNLEGGQGALCFHGCKKRTGVLQNSSNDFYFRA